MRMKNILIINQLERIIDEYRENTGTVPSTYEMAQVIGVGQSTVVRYLAYMREQGIIEYAGHRGYVTKSAQMIRDERVRVPVLSESLCETPLLSEKNIVEYLYLPVSLFGRGSFFLIRQNGKSKEDIGINDADVVLVRRQETAAPGQIIAVLLNEKIILRRFDSEQEYTHLQSGTICGIAIKVVRDLD